MCSGFSQVFREQAIDGETLPLLTEEHLLNNMGLKLGPALKIRSQVGSAPTPWPASRFRAVSSQDRAARTPVLRNRDYQAIIVHLQICNSAFKLSRTLLWR